MMNKSEENFKYKIFMNTEKRISVNTKPSYLGFARFGIHEDKIREKMGSNYSVWKSDTENFLDGVLTELHIEGDLVKLVENESKGISKKNIADRVLKKYELHPNFLQFQLLNYIRNNSEKNESKVFHKPQESDLLTKYF